MSEKQISRTRSLGNKTIFAALQALKDNGNELPSREVKDEVEKRVDLDSWEKERYEKTGYIRWESVLHFYSINCTKAGFLVKKEGRWYLTEEGELALELGPEKLLDVAIEAYKKWRSEKAQDETPEVDELAEQAESTMTLEQIEQIAREALETHIAAKNPYEFQDLAAALLRGMGYHTPFVAPRGKDGGVDIIAYRDPLGTVTPRIKVQVKHKKDPAGVAEVRQLMGILQQGGDVGIFVSTGGFSTDAKVLARSSPIHVELIDRNRFINLWVKFYSSLNDEDKTELPLHPVYFLAPQD